MTLTRADARDVLKEALAAAAGRLTVDDKDAQDFLKKTARAHERSLESLLKAFIGGRIDEETFRSELADERRVFRAALVAAESLSPKGAKDASNAFFGSVEATLREGGLA